MYLNYIFKGKRRSGLANKRLYIIDNLKIKTLGVEFYKSFADLVGRNKIGKPDRGINRVRSLLYDKGGVTGVGVPASLGKKQRAVNVRDSDRVVFHDIFKAVKRRVMRDKPACDGWVETYDLAMVTDSAEKISIAYSHITNKTAHIDERKVMAIIYQVQ